LFITTGISISVKQKNKVTEGYILEHG